MKLSIVLAILQGLKFVIRHIVIKKRDKAIEWMNAQEGNDLYICVNLDMKDDIEEILPVVDELDLGNG